MNITALLCRVIENSNKLAIANVLVRHVIDVHQQGYPEGMPLVGLPEDYDEVILRIVEDFDYSKLIIDSAAADYGLTLAFAHTQIASVYGVDSPDELLRLFQKSVMSRSSGESTHADSEEAESLGILPDTIETGLDNVPPEKFKQLMEKVLFPTVAFGDEGISISKVISNFNADASFPAEYKTPKNKCTAVLARALLDLLVPHGIVELSGSKENKRVSQYHLFTPGEHAEMEPMETSSDDEVKTADGSNVGTAEDLKKMAILKVMLRETMSKEELLDKYWTNLKEHKTLKGNGDTRKNKVVHPSPQKLKKKPKQSKEAKEAARKKMEDELIALDD